MFAYGSGIKNIWQSRNEIYSQKRARIPIVQGFVLANFTDLYCKYRKVLFGSAHRHAWDAGDVGFGFSDLIRRVELS